MILNVKTPLENKFPLIIYINNVLLEMQKNLTDTISIIISLFFTLPTFEFQFVL